MAVDINQLNAQFDAFVTFARDHKDQPNYIARIEKRKPGAGLIDLDGQVRTIAAKSWDGRAQFWRTSGSRKVNNDVRTLFLDTILGICGVDKIEKLPASVQAVLKAEDFDGKGHPLTARRIKAVTDAVRTASGMMEAAGGIASGFSPAVQKIQDFVMTAPCVPANAEPDKKMAAFVAKFSENTAKHIATNIAHLIGKHFIVNGQMNADADHEQFIKDQRRDMRVFIEKNGPTEVSKNYREARDEFVQFITGGEVDTFEEASESVKRQTQILMSIINQYTATSVVNAFNETIERPNADRKCLLSGSEGKAGTGMDFSLSKTSDGGILISFGQAVATEVLTVSDENGADPYFMNNDLSSCHIGVEINLPAASLQRLADGDWTQIDYKDFKNHTTDEQFELMPKGLRLDANVTASAHFEMYNGDAPWEKAQAQGV